MYTDSYASQITAPTRRGRSSDPAAFPSLEEQYRKAKARLSAAQQEKMEATAAFLDARAALSRRMEEIWPGQDE